MIGECYIGDARDGLRAMIVAGVRAQTCVTSPPYWGLRDYGTAEWEGGDAECDHKHGGQVVQTKHPAAADSFATGLRPGTDNSKCGKCNAIRIDRQLGLEPTIAEYVTNMVEVFRLVRAVLADDGTVWLNLGDSYASSCTGYNPTAPSNVARQNGEWIGKFHPAGTERLASRKRTSRLSPELKVKDLCGIPWRVAFALQADGWYLRQDIIWAKPNPMPESVTDRCTKSHEYIFLLSKRERYYYDAEAIREEEKDPGASAAKIAYQLVKQRSMPAYSADPRVASMRNWKGEGDTYDGGRNKRSVWTVTTQPYSEAHFATFPPKLIEPCIMAGSRVGDVVLDPFMGSGTVGQVSQDLGRRWLGCELNPEYVKLQSKRTAQSGLELHA